MDEDFVDDFDVRTMANLIGRPLSDGRLRYRSINQPSTRTATSNSTMKPVVRITGKDGSIVHPRMNGKEDKKVRVRQQSCFICRQYTQKTINTQWKCRICGMPLCQVDRSDGIARRPYSCIDEHLSSHNEYIGCNLMKHNSFILPDDLRKYTMTRQQEQIREQDRQKKRMERQVQSGSTESVSTPEEKWSRALVREHEKRRMDEAKSACSRAV